MLRFYCVLGWSPRDINMAPSSSRETVSKWDIQRPLKTCSCFPIYLPWLRMFNKGLHIHRWRWLTGKRPLPPRLMTWIWFLGPTWRKERINSLQFCSQTTTCMLWYVYTHTYFTHIKIRTGTLSQKAAVLRAIMVWIIRVKSTGLWGQGSPVSFLPTSACVTCKTGYRAKAQERLLEDAPQTWGTSHVTSRELSLTAVERLLTSCRATENDSEKSLAFGGVCKERSQSNPWASQASSGRRLVSWAGFDDVTLIFCSRNGFCKGLKRCCVPLCPESEPRVYEMG